MRRDDAVYHFGLVAVGDALNTVATDVEQGFQVAGACRCDAAGQLTMGADQRPMMFGLCSRGSECR